MPELVAVLGATGRTGGATVRHLVDRGVSVRAFSRDPEGSGAAVLRSGAVEVVRADMDDVSSMEKALTGVDALFSVQPGFDDRGRYQSEIELAQGAAVARAAAAAGVGHVVQLSAGLGEPTGVPHFDNKLAIRREFEDRGLPVTAIHPGPFMELMVDPGFAPALSTWGAQPRVVGWDRPYPWVAVDDVGAAAADALLGDPPVDGSTQVLFGDSRSLRECREVLSSVGRRPRRFPMPVWAFRKAVGDELVEMWTWMTTAEMPGVTPGLTDVETWARRLGD